MEKKELRKLEKIIKNFHQAKCEEITYSKCHFSCDSGMGTSTRISDLLPIKFCMEKRQINFSNLNSAAAMPMIIAGDLFRVQFKTKFSYFDHHCILTAVVADLFRL